MKIQTVNPVHGLSPRHNAGNIKAETGISSSVKTKLDSKLAKFNQLVPPAYSG